MLRRQLAILLCEQHVVISLGVERRVKIDEVYRLIFDVAPQDVQIVAVLQMVVRHAAVSFAGRPPFAF